MYVPVKTKYILRLRKASPYPHTETSHCTSKKAILHLVLTIIHLSQVFWLRF